MYGLILYINFLTFIDYINRFETKRVQIRSAYKIHMHECIEVFTYLGKAYGTSHLFYFNMKLCFNEKIKQNQFINKCKKTIL